MSEAKHVTIGSAFFANELREYADWRAAWCRELAQNGVDSRGCRRIGFEFSARDDGTTLAVGENDGAPMDEATLVGKLLALGETGKGTADSIGGFGKAKLLLMFAHCSWSVRTGTLAVAGVGGDYSLTRGLEPLRGTRTEVVMAGDQAAALRAATRAMAALMQWGGELRLDGTVLATSCRKGTRRKDLSFGTVYTSQQASRQLVVRVNGMPMFTGACALDRLVVVELQAERSRELLTANRDGLRWAHQRELETFMQALAVDKRSALREQKAAYRRFEGERLRAAARRPQAAGTGFVAELLGPAATSSGAAFAGASSAGCVALERAESRVSIGPEFILKQCLGMETPRHYVPGDDFSGYSRRLAAGWARCLLELHRILELDGEFSIGFIFDDEVEAESERSASYGQVYYVNPATVRRQASGQGRSLANRWPGAWQARHELIALAVHEVVHGAYGLGPHDEDYASKLTEVMAAVLPHVSRLSALFRAH